MKTESYLDLWEAELREQKQALKIAKKLEKIKTKTPFKDTAFGRACAVTALGMCRPFVMLQEKTLQWMTSQPQLEAAQELQDILRQAARIDNTNEQALEVANNLARVFLTQQLSEEDQEKIKEEIQRVRPEPPKEGLVPELN